MMTMVLVPYFLPSALFIFVKSLFFSLLVVGVFRDAILSFILHGLFSAHKNQMPFFPTAQMGLSVFEIKTFCPFCLLLCHFIAPKPTFFCFLRFLLATNNLASEKTFSPPAVKVVNCLDASLARKTEEFNWIEFRLI